MQKELHLPWGLLLSRITGTGPRYLSEYEDGTWGLSHHLRILQHIHNLESKLWKYDDGTFIVSLFW